MLVSALRASISTSPPAGGPARTRKTEEGSASALSVISSVSFSERVGMNGAAAAAASAAASSGVSSSAKPKVSSLKHWAKIYSELSKARLSALVVATTTPGFLMAGTPVDWGTCAAVSAGTTLAACSAATWNQILETVGLVSSRLVLARIVLFSSLSLQLLLLLLAPLLLLPLVPLIDSRRAPP